MYGNDNYLVNGKGAVALRAANGAYAILENVVLNGENSIAAISENGDGAVFSYGTISGSGKNITGLQASEIILSAEGGGSAINNRAETTSIALNNAYIIPIDGASIRSATSFDHNGKATLDVMGSGVATCSRRRMAQPPPTICVSDRATPLSSTAATGSQSRAAPLTAA